MGPHRDNPNATNGGQFVSVSEALALLDERLARLVDGIREMNRFAHFAKPEERDGFASDIRKAEREIRCIMQGTKRSIQQNAERRAEQRGHRKLWKRSTAIDSLPPEELLPVAAGDDCDDVEGAD